jgi:15-cis-phytoene synthase
MPSNPKHFTNSRTTSFYYSFLFLPVEKRRAIEAVYYFARHSDDVADDLRGSRDALQEMGRYRALLDECYRYERKQFDDPALEALAKAIWHFRIPRRHFEELLLGLEMDLRMDETAGRYRTFAELELYCYRVASTIGLIAIEIFGYKNAKTRDYAIQLGKALQIVNILRDVQSDARRGRVYLPLEDMERFEVDPSRLASGCYGEAFVRLMRFECGRALRYFSEARRFLPPEDRRSMRPAEIMAAIYWRLMQKIQKRAYNIFGAPVRLSRPAKLLTALSVRAGMEWHR